MSCKFYYWNGGTFGDYHCAKSDSRVASDWYYKYCRDYSYDDCPVYKGYMQRPADTNGGSGGCYLTSACVEARGLADDCRELTVLRRFRDGWLKEQPCGGCDVEEYYCTAPAIVEAIRKLPNAAEVFDAIYRELVRPCVALIDGGDNAGAYRAYKDYTRKLREKYLEG